MHNPSNFSASSRVREKGAEREKDRARDGGEQKGIKKFLTKKLIAK